MPPPKKPFQGQVCGIVYWIPTPTLLHNNHKEVAWNQRQQPQHKHILKSRIPSKQYFVSAWHSNRCERRPKNSSELYWKCSSVQTVNNQEAQSASTVKVLNGAGVSGERVQRGCRQTESGQVQSPKTEGRSGYRGRDEETPSGTEGRSGTRRSIWESAGE